MEERLEALQEAWNSFVVEFPTYPKIASRGHEETQRILFLCPTQEENPTDLCLALFGSQILINRLQREAGTESLPRARFVFVYAAETPASLPDIVSHYRVRVNAPILISHKSNVLKSAQLVTDYLARAVLPPNEAATGNWGETQPAGSSAAGNAIAAPAGDEALLWQEGLPEIVLADSKGNSVRAAATLQDYRAEYACRYVLAHFQENINRDKMAEMVNLSPGYFSNLFRAEVGMSFSDYLIQVRIENAKRLLRRFDLSVEAISKQCGFNSLAHFSRTFKDRCGLSPLKFRKNPNSQA